jgi:hypothetical protein
MAWLSGKTIERVCFAAALLVTIGGVLFGRCSG